MSVTFSPQKAFFFLLATLILVNCGGSDKSTPESTEPTTVTPIPDTIAPIITLNGDSSIFISLGSDYEEAGATAVDNIDGKVSVEIANAAVDTLAVGGYIVTYTAKDSAGNRAQVTRQVSVVDAEAPVITLNGASDLRVLLGDEYIELGAVVTDNSKVELSISISGAVDTSVLGQYFITYSAVDPSGNEVTTQRVVNVEQPRPFITLWNTGGWGASNNNQIQINTSREYEYNYRIDWGDGLIDENVKGSITHTYEQRGEYRVKISGEFPHFVMSDITVVQDFSDDSVLTFISSDNHKLISVEQWGDIKWRSMENSFVDTLVTISAEDSPNLSNVESMYFMFGCTDNWVAPFPCTREIHNINNWDVSNVKDMSYLFKCSIFVECSFNWSLSNWDVSNVTNMSYMFNAFREFNDDISKWNTSKVQKMDSMFAGAESFDQGISSWNVANVKTMDGMFQGVTLSTANYDALLLGWSTQQLQSNVPFHGGNSKYSSAAEAARQSLIDQFDWIITDGGESD